MSEETQRQLRQVPRINYQILGSTGAVVLRTPFEGSPTASSTSTSVSLNDSSSESTLTPASSENDLLDATLVNESPGDQPLASAPSIPLIDQYPESIDSASSSSPVLSAVNNNLFEALGEIEETFKMTEGRHEILGKIGLLIDGLNDYIDENSMHGSYVSIEDIDENIRRVESMRTEYRVLHRGLLDCVGETEYKELYSAK